MMTFPAFKYKLLIALMCVASCICGQTRRQMILSSDKGLSSTLIGDILQDKSGNLWIATENGLNKYNGVRLKNYFHDDSDKHSIASNYVRTLFEDNQGNLFIGTYAGVQIYNPATDSFSLVSAFENGEPYSYVINHIIQRHNGDILISGEHLCRLSINDGNPIVEILNLPIPTNQIEEVFEDSEGRLWTTNSQEGVFRLDPDNSVHHYLNDRTTPPFILRIIEDKKGNILAGSSNEGMYIYNKETDKIEVLDNGRYIVCSLFVNDDNQTFICTDGYGLKVFDNRTGTIADYQADIEIIESSAAKIHSVTRDNKENLWLGIYQHGALMLPNKKSAFNYLGSHSRQYDIIGSCCVTSIELGEKGEIFIGTDNDGLYIVSEDKKSSRHLSPKSYANIPSIIIGLLEDSDGNLWMGSYGYGAAILNRKTMKCDIVKGITDASDENNMVSNVYDFVEDNNRHVWIATMGGGLKRYDLNTKNITTCTDINRLINNWITCIEYSDDTNALLIGTYDGLWRIGLNDFGNDNEQILSRSIIHDICEDAEGVIWAATSDGLARWGEDSHVIMFTQEDNLPSNICYAVLTDELNQLWVSTGHGLMRMNRKEFYCTNFYVEDGIQGNEFIKNACKRNPKTKEIYFGGVNGVTWFKPGDVLPNSQKWEVHIAEMYIAGNAVKVGTKSGGKDIISVPVQEAKEFNLNHEDNAFTLEIGTDDLSDSDKKIIYYSMDESKWAALPKGSKQISFSNLPAGNYSFKMKVVDGTIESDVKEVRIRIRPAWWQTWWAILLEIFATAYILYLTLDQIRHRQIMKLKMLYHIQSERHAESKLQFLTNVSHKIRTPMTLIINPLKQLIDKDKDEERQENYQMMQRNAERIMTLVNEFMDPNKYDQVTMKEEIEKWHNRHLVNAKTQKPKTQESKQTNEDDRQTIVVAEDDTEIRNYLETELSKEYNILTFNNGQDALENITIKVPDIIISDVMMPKLDGFSLVKKIRQNVQLNDVPIILLTARTMNEDYIKGLELGADAYITKPFDIRVLMQNVSSLLKSRRALKNIYSGNQAQEGKVAELKAKNPDEILIEKVMKCINDNLSNNALSVEMIAQEVGVSRIHLHRKLKQLTNQAPRDLIRNQRINIAAKLLREKKMPIAEVAYHVGFSTPAHFATTFKAMFGMSPTQYSEQNN